MSSNIVKEIELENNHTLVISDCSRKISEDAYVVVMKANMEIKVDDKLFSDEPVSEFKFEDIRSVLGDHIVYEYRLERNFIMDHEKEEVFGSLMASFLDNIGKYVAKPAFPRKLVLKEYKDRL
jgi:hypothetical protein